MMLKLDAIRKKKCDIRSVTWHSIRFLQQHCQRRTSSPWPPGGHGSQYHHRFSWTWRAKSIRVINRGLLENQTTLSAYKLFCVGSVSWLCAHRQSRKHSVCRRIILQPLVVSPARSYVAEEKKTSALLRVNRNTCSFAACVSSRYLVTPFCRTAEGRPAHTVNSQRHRWKYLARFTFWKMVIGRGVPLDLNPARPTLWSRLISPRAKWRHMEPTKPNPARPK